MAARVARALLLIALITGGCTTATVNAVDVAFTKVSGGVAAGGLGTAFELRVATNLPEFQRIYAEVHANQVPPPKPPKIAVRGVMVFAIRAAQRTGGYGIEVKKVEHADEALVVTVERTAPGPNMMVIQAITRPYVLVQVMQRPEGVTKVRAVDSASGEVLATAPIP